MSARLLLISSDEAAAKAVRSALDSAMSLMVLDHLPADGVAEKFEPNVVLIDSDVRSGVQTAFEKSRRQNANLRMSRLSFLVMR